MDIKFAVFQRFDMPAFRRFGVAAVAAFYASALPAAEVTVTTPVPEAVVVQAPPASGAPSTLVVTQAEQTIVVKVPAAPVVVQTPAAAPAAPATRRIVVFVKNQTRVPGMDDQVDGIRDRLVTALSGVGRFTVIDSAQVADTFRRYKVTTAEERSGLVDGVFTGGSVPRIAQMLGCDYVVAASVIGASYLHQNVNGNQTTTFTVRMTTKVMDPTGASVYGTPWKASEPVLNVANDPMNYFDELFDRWADDASADLANRAATWRAPAAAADAVPFAVATTVDASIAELESATKGVDGKLLLELRKVVGGVSVELDGAMIGTSPGQFAAAPGLHQLKITRQWMTPWQGTVDIRPGSVFNVALELSADGIAKYKSMEVFRGQLAIDYAQAAAMRAVRVDTSAAGWREASSGAVPPQVIIQTVPSSSGVVAQPAAAPAAVQ